MKECKSTKNFQIFLEDGRENKKLGHTRLRPRKKYGKRERWVGGGKREEKVGARHRRLVVAGKNNT